MWRCDEWVTGSGTGPRDPVVLRWKPGASRASFVEGIWHRHRASTCWRWREGGTVHGRLWCRCGAEWTGHRWSTVPVTGHGECRTAARSVVVGR